MQRSESPTVYNQIRTIMGVRDIIRLMAEIERERETAETTLQDGLEMLANTLDIAINALDDAVDDCHERPALGGVTTEAWKQTETVSWKCSHAPKGGDADDAN